LKLGDSPSQIALQTLQGVESGVIVVLRGNNRPQGLAVEIKSWFGEAQAQEMDARDYGVGAQILRALGAHQIRLLSNRPEKKVGLKAFGLEIVQVVPLTGPQKESYGAQNRRGHVPLQ
jgi:3,4-dihydroxy 2-butanone 4-phosphate synthase/GTP cyclohydrolase II